MTRRLATSRSVDSSLRRGHRLKTLTPSAMLSALKGPVSFALLSFRLVSPSFAMASSGSHSGPPYNLDPAKGKAVNAGDLLVAHYAFKAMNQNNTKEHPNHWAIFLMISPIEGYAHQIVSVKTAGEDYVYDDGFKNFLTTNKASSLKKSSALQGFVIIGHVPHGKEADFHKILDAVPVVNDKQKPPAWNCQTWVLDALPGLQNGGFVNSTVTGDAIKNAFGAP